MTNQRTTRPMRLTQRAIANMNRNKHTEWSNENEREWESESPIRDTRITAVFSDLNQDCLPSPIPDPMTIHGHPWNSRP